LFLVSRIEAGCASSPLGLAGIDEELVRKPAPPAGIISNMKKRPPESAVAVTWPQVTAFLDRPLAIDIASGG